MQFTRKSEPKNDQKIKLHFEGIHFRPSMVFSLHRRNDVTNDCEITKIINLCLGTGIDEKRPKRGTLFLLLLIINDFLASSRAQKTVACGYRVISQTHSARSTSRPRRQGTGAQFTNLFQQILMYGFLARLKASVTMSNTQTLDKFQCLSIYGRGLTGEGHATSSCFLSMAVHCEKNIVSRKMTYARVLSKDCLWRWVS